MSKFYLKLLPGIHLILINSNGIQMGFREENRVLSRWKVCFIIMKVLLSVFFYPFKVMESNEADCLLFILLWISPQILSSPQARTWYSNGIQWTAYHDLVLLALYDLESWKFYLKNWSFACFCKEFQICVCF